MPATETTPSRSTATRAAASSRGSTRRWSGLHAHHLHGGDLVPDPPRAQVGAHGRAAGPGDEEGRGHRRLLPHHGQHHGRPELGLGTDLLEERPHLEGDDHAERDRDEDQRHGGHPGQEPALVEEFADRHPPAETEAEGLEGRGDHGADVADERQGLLERRSGRGAPGAPGQDRRHVRPVRAVPSPLPAVVDGRHHLPAPRLPPTRPLPSDVRCTRYTVATTPWCGPRGRVPRCGLPAHPAGAVPSFVYLLENGGSGGTFRSRR